MAEKGEHSDGQVSDGAQGVLWHATPAERAAGEARDAQLRRAKRAQARDVQIPARKDPVRWESCRYDLRRFLVTYLGGLFKRKFAQYHEEIIQDLQHIILYGGLKAFAAPRAGGKSTIVVGTVLWALLYGHRRFLVILAGNHKNSTDRLNSIRMQIETNPRLAEDFPGPTACVRALAGSWNRSNAQTFAGERTFISWGGAERLVFPNLPDCDSSGTVVATESMKTAIRGLSHATPNGEQVRPDMVLLDDPIERDQAQSPYIVEQREKKIQRDVLNLGGPDTSISGILIGTCIRQDDLMFRYLDRERHPEWMGIRYQMVDQLPERMDLWEQYDELRRDSLKQHRDYRMATEFYLANRAEMHKGCKPSWQERVRRDMGEIDAVQCAVDYYYEEGEEAFQSEFQNDPPDLADDSPLLVSAEGVQRKTTRWERGVVPDGALAMVAGVDVGKWGLHWVTAAVSPGRILHVVDYGVQDVNAPTGRIDHDDPERMQALERAVSTALNELAEKWAAEPYCYATGEIVPLRLAFIDCRYLTSLICDWCAEQERATGRQTFLPIMGHGTAKSQPVYRPPKDSALTKDGYLYRRRDSGRRVIYHADADSYKQVVHTGFLLPEAEGGSVQLFKPERRNTHHSYSHHIVAEAQMEDPPGSGVYKWQKVRGRSSNHYLDATYNAVATVSYVEYPIPAISLSREPERPKAGPQTEDEKALDRRKRPQGWRREKPRQGGFVRTSERGKPFLRNRR